MGFVLVDDTLFTERYLEFVLLVAKFLQSAEGF
jgi:hypothetical protein